MTVAVDIVEQAKQGLKNIGAALAEAGAGFEDVIRVRYMLTKREISNHAGGCCEAASVPRARPRR